MTNFEKQLIDEKFPDEADRQRAYARLADHEPLGYILGEWYFYDQVYRLNEACLIPRPDTEHLVEAAIKRIPAGGRFLDLCTGSGCVAISILCHRPDLRAAALDISPRALEAARENAHLNGVADRISFICADMLADGWQKHAGTFAGVTANPPYIRPEVIAGLSEEVRREPYAALYGGEDGLDFYRRIGELQPALLPEGGPLMMEIGYDQAEDVCALFGVGREAVIRDYGGNDRVIVVN